MRHSLWADRLGCSTPMELHALVESLRSTFSSVDLFPAAYVNERRYLTMYRLHARVCGLLARVGTDLGFIVDIGRRYPIDPIPGPTGRSQRQAEADVSFVDRKTQNPVALLDYETSDAPIYKMRHKFQYLSTFAKHSPAIELVGFFITVTAVRHHWDNETPDDRQRFAHQEILDLTSQLCQASHNASLTFMLGVFGPNELSLRAFKGTDHLLKENIPYSVDAAGPR